jgi:glycosyltransferase involved in cell wall biosynthesis
MVDEADLAVVGQDPRFGGGFRSMATAFWTAADELGRKPHLYFLSRAHGLRLVPPSLSRLRARQETFHDPFHATALPSTLPELDGVNQLLGGLRIARRVRRARTRWVVATTAPYGFGALVSGKPYGLWLATGLESEWEARRGGLPLSRRLALVLNRPVLRILERAVIRRASLVYALSPSSRRTLAEGSGLPESRVRVLPIPVDLDLFAPVPDEEWRAGLERPVLAFAGRANDPRKNFRLLADAFADVRAVFPEARLRAIGERPHAHDLGRAADAVDLLGPMWNRDLAAHLRTASIFVLPSLQEGFGIVVAEALAAGIPVVTTPSGGPEDLVRESGGGIVVAGFGPDELADAVLELLRDPDRLADMRRRGREFVAREHSPGRFRELLAAGLEELERRA